LASFLPTGSIALIYYANRFMQIPLGVIASAFSMILLPHFSRVGVYAPRRLNFYLLESLKLIVWIMIPIMVFMIFTAEKIFLTLFLSDKFTLAAVKQASIILHAFLYGLAFYSINKILLNVYYALHETKIPMYSYILATTLNFVVSYSMLPILGAYGLALATTFSGIAQTVIYLLFLKIRFNFTFYWQHFLRFFLLSMLQFLSFATLFYVLYVLCIALIQTFSVTVQDFLLIKLGFWLWIMPLFSMLFFLMNRTRRWFGIKLFFLDE
jgi:putative peptidoglycan lipid II flippase